VAPSQNPARADKKTSEPEAGIPASIVDRGALRFWLAVILTGVAAGLGAAGLTALLTPMRHARTTCGWCPPADQHGRFRSGAQATISQPIP
jgi:hypothetical protein